MNKFLVTRNDFHDYLCAYNYVVQILRGEKHLVSNKEIGACWGFNKKVGMCIANLIKTSIMYLEIVHILSVGKKSGNPQY